MANGVKEIIPAESINRVIDLSIELGRNDVMLCGEREGRLVDGFHLGNSPIEYKREVVEGKTLIFGSTNGSPAILRSSVAKSTYVCGFINLDAVVRSLYHRETPYPLAILCSGKNDRFALEDAVCGGMLIDRFLNRINDKVTLNDGARASLLLYKEFGSNINQLLNECDHGKYIKEIDMEADLPICAQDSTLNIVPILKDGKLVNSVKTVS